MSAKGMTVQLVGIILLMVAAACAGNLLMKVGADATNELAIVHRLLDWRILIGLSLFGLSVIFYVVLLGALPLNVAQSMMALQYVAVIITSVLLLGEALPLLRLVGAAFILIGVVLIGLSAG
jgi:undecaprenyl phosphate-alpha-L-ara4N flippase subunit ArnE